MRNMQITNNDAGCSTVAHRNTPQGTPPMPGLKRIIWKKGRLFVFQDTSGAYWWADVDRGIKRAAVLRRGTIGAHLGRTVPNYPGAHGRDQNSATVAE